MSAPFRTVLRCLNAGRSLRVQIRDAVDKQDFYDILYALLTVFPSPFTRKKPTAI